MVFVESGERKAVLNHVGFKYNYIHKYATVKSDDKVQVKAVLVTQHIIGSRVL
jgi:hypothetical protein